MRQALLLFLVLGLPGLSYGQLPYFNERYDNHGEQSGLLAILPTDSGFMAAGQSVGYPYPDGYALMVRLLNAQGHQMRVRYFGQAGHSYSAPGYGGGLFRLPGQRYAMVGTHRPLIDSLQTGMLWFFDAQGDTLWTKQYAQPPQQVLYSGCQTPDGGFALVGAVNRVPAGSGSELLLLRTDSVGNLRWWHRYGVTYGNIGYWVFPTADGGFVLSGYCHARGTANGTNSAPYVVKVDSVGGLQWQRILTPVTADDGPCSSARPLANGGYAVAAKRKRGTVGGYEQYQGMLYKLNDQGQTVWQRPIGPVRRNTEYYLVHELADGALVVAGQQSDTLGLLPGTGVPEGVVFKVCASGDSLWYRTYRKLPGRNSHNYLRDLQPTPDGGFVGAGFLFAFAPDSGSHDAWAFKIDSAGYLQAGGAPVTVACPTVGVAPDAPTEPAVQFWPNPLEADVKVAWRLPSGQVAAHLQLFDALGRRVLALALNGASGQLTVPVRALPPGLYSYRVLAGGRRVQSGSLVKLP